MLPRIPTLTAILSILALVGAGVTAQATHCATATQACAGTAIEIVLFVVSDDGKVAEYGGKDRNKSDARETAEYAVSDKDTLILCVTTVPSGAYFCVTAFLGREQGSAMKFKGGAESAVLLAQQGLLA